MSVDWVARALAIAKVPTASPSFTGNVLLPSGNMGIAKSNPANAKLYIGSGSGSLTDVGGSGINVKLDIGAGLRGDGIRSNINITQGAANGNTIGMVSRIDINDTASTGDTVGAWADVFVRAASLRNTWGFNFYSSIGDSASPGTLTYNGVAVGGEVALSNWGTIRNGGGGLHVVCNGVAAMAFGIRLGFKTGIVENGILVPDELSAAPGGVTQNLLFYGAILAANIIDTSKVPKLVIDYRGFIGIGKVPMVALDVVGDARHTGYLDLLPRAAPGTPPAGVRLYVDSGDNKLKAINAAGTVTALT